MSGWTRSAAVGSLFLLCVAVPQGREVTPSSTTGIQTPEDERLHNELRELRDGLVAALNSGDIDGILKYLHRNVVFTAMNADVARGQDQVRAYFDRMMKGPDRIVESIEVDPEVDALSDLYGQDAAISYGSSRDRYRLTNGMAFEVRSRWSCALVREEGRWLIASFHSSANVFDNPILARTKRLVYQGGGVAGVAGMLLGLVIGRVWGRKAAGSGRQV